MIDLHSPSMDRLFQAIMQLESVEACYAFFEDLCTVKEVQDMAQRFDAALLLSEGVSYQEIGRQIGISSATVCRVSKCLNYGTGGYRSAIEKLRKEEMTDGSQ